MVEHFPMRWRGRGAEIDLHQFSPDRYRAAGSVLESSRGPMPPRLSKVDAPAPPARRRSLGEACRELGLDTHGMRCPACPLKVLCVTETRWRVPRVRRPRDMV